MHKVVYIQSICGARLFSVRLANGKGTLTNDGAALEDGRISDEFAANAAQVLSMERVGEGWEAAQRELAGLVGKVGPEELEAVLWGLKRRLDAGEVKDFAAAIAEERAKYNEKKGGAEGKLDSDQVLVETADGGLMTLGEVEAESGNGELGTGNGEFGNEKPGIGNEKPGIGNEKPKVEGRPNAVGRAEVGKIRENGVSEETKQEFSSDQETSSWNVETEPEVFRRLEPIAVKPAAPVTQETGNNAVKRAIKKLFALFGRVKNQTDGLEVVFNGRDSGKMMMQSGVDMRTFAPQLKELFETSVPAWTEPPMSMKGHKDHPDVTGYRHYVNKFVDASGKEFYIRFTVREHLGSEGRKGVHAATVSEVAIYEDANAAGTVRANKSRGTDRAFVDIRLAKFIEKGKGASLKYGSEPRVNAAEAPELAAAEGAGQNKAVALQPVAGKPGTFATLSHPKARFTVDGEKKVVAVDGLTAEDFAPGRGESAAALVARVEAYAADNGLSIGFRDDAVMEAWRAAREQIKAEAAERAAREQLKETTNVVIGELQKSFPGSEVVSSIEEFNAKTGRKLTTADGQVYGIVDPETGHVYLNPEIFGTQIGLETSIHEFGHLGIIECEKVNKPVYDRGVKLAMELLEGKGLTQSSQSPQSGDGETSRTSRTSRETNGGIQELVDFVNATYADHSAKGKAEELMAQLIGKRGAAALKSETNATVVQKIKSWLVEFWNTFGKARGLKDITPEQAEKMTLEDVADAIRAEMFSGRKYGEGLTVGKDNGKLSGVDQKRLTEVIRGLGSGELKHPRFTKEEAAASQGAEHERLWSYILSLESPDVHAGGGETRTSNDGADGSQGGSRLGCLGRMATRYGSDPRALVAESYKYLDSGAESKVYVSESGKGVIKVRSLNAIDIDGVKHELAKIVYHNSLFPKDAYTLRDIAVWNNKGHDEFYLILEQPLVTPKTDAKGNIVAPTEEQITRALQNTGKRFSIWDEAWDREDMDSDGDFSSADFATSARKIAFNGEFMVYDFKPGRNTFIDAETGEVRFIDPRVDINDPGAGFSVSKFGKRRINNDPVSCDGQPSGSGEGSKYAAGFGGVEFAAGGARIVTKPVRIRKQLTGRRKAVNDFVKLMGGAEDPANPETDLLSLWVDNGGRLFDRMPFEVETSYSKGASGVKTTRRAVADEFAESTAFYRDLDPAQRRVFFGTGKLETGPIGEGLKNALEEAGITRFTREDGTVDFEAVIDEFKRQWTNYERGEEVLKERNEWQEERDRAYVEEMERAEQAAYDEMSAEEAAARAEMEAADAATDVQIAADVAAGRFSRRGPLFSRKGNEVPPSTLGDGKQRYYEVPFDKAVDKIVKNGKPIGDESVFVSETPEAFAKIGFAKLPIMMTQKHVLTISNDAASLRKLGISGNAHDMKQALKQVPGAIRKPLMIIASETKPDSGVVAITQLRDKNGKSVIVPVEIAGEGWVAGNTRIDAHIMTSAYGKDNAWSKLVANAIEAERNGKVGVFFIDSTKASVIENQLASVVKSGVRSTAGLQLPRTASRQSPSNFRSWFSTLRNPDSVHSIADPGSPVNAASMVRETETRQFKNWFGDSKKNPAGASKIVDENGEPLRVYRGAEFDPLAEEAGKGVIKPEAYFTADQNYAKRYAGSEGAVRAYYLNIRHPFDIRDPECQKDFEKIHPGQKLARGKSGALDWAEAATIDGEFLEENFPGKYDGIIFDEASDWVPDGNTPKWRGLSYVPLHGGAQVKSATDNIGTFDPGNPDVRFSRGTRPEAKYVKLTRVADDAGAGEQTPGALAASAELMRQAPTPLTQKGTRYVSLPLSELHALSRYLTGHAMPAEMESGKKLGAAGKASLKHMKLTIAADILGVVDKTDAAAETATLKQHGFFRHENANWCATHSPAEVRQERARSEDALSSRLETLADRRIAGREPGGNAAGRKVFADQLAKVVMAMPHGQPGVLGAMQTVAGALEKRVKVNKAVYDRGMKLAMELLEGKDLTQSSQSPQSGDGETSRTSRTSRETNGGIQELVDFVNATYADHSAKGKAEELLVQLIGKRGEEALRAETNKTVVGKIKSWLVEFWNTFGKALGLKEITPEQVADAIRAEMFSGRKYGELEYPQFVTLETGRMPDSIGQDAFSGSEISEKSVPLAGCGIMPLAKNHQGGTDMGNDSIIAFKTREQLRLS